MPLLQCICIILLVFNVLYYCNSQMDFIKIAQIKIFVDVTKMQLLHILTLD